MTQSSCDPQKNAPVMRLTIFSLMSLLAAPVSLISAQEVGIASRFVGNGVSGSLLVEEPVGLLLTQHPLRTEAYLSDSIASLLIADNFQTPLSGSDWRITEIVIWGGYLTRSVTNETDRFDVTIYTDSGGVPGSLIDARSGIEASSRVATGIQLFGMDEYMFTFDYSESPVRLSDGGYWIAISNDIRGGPTDGFFWEAGDMGPSSAPDAIALALGAEYLPKALFSRDTGRSWNFFDGDLAIVIDMEFDRL